MSIDPSENGSSNALSSVLGVISDLAHKSEGDNYIYRGERKPYPKVSSSLYRQYEEIDAEGFDIEVVQGEILNEAKAYIRYTGETDEFEILSQLQHNGGLTNLIDFTTDYLIALFFACDGEPEEPGRVILLPENGTNYDLEYPNSPVHRVIAQKSVFVRPQKGFVEPLETVSVISDLKPVVLDYLRTRHGISAESIYNDLHGFIKYQGIHQSAYVEFYKGVTFQTVEEFQRSVEHYTASIALSPQQPAAYNNRGNVYIEMGNYRFAIADYERALSFNPEHPLVLHNLGNAYQRQGNYDRAVECYSRSLTFREDGETYCNRGEAWLHKAEWDKARQDLMQAVHMEIDIITSFHNDYADVADFETKNLKDLPKDIADMLGG